ncbi:hypothetical protein GCM10018787_35150 [Streptomyces thermodiastaticus]|nr:hypothetical protein GCM10018787_35150 [Streptomyces thermodiastaticus]
MAVDNRTHSLVTTPDASVMCMLGYRLSRAPGGMSAEAIGCRDVRVHRPSASRPPPCRSLRRDHHGRSEHRATNYGSDPNIPRIRPFRLRRVFRAAAVRRVRPAAARAAGAAFAPCPARP